MKRLPLEAFLRLDASWIRPALTRGRLRLEGGGHRVDLTSDDDHLLVDGTPVAIERVAQHLGGARLWLRCPSCGARRGVLFGFEQSWACRVCWRGSYPSQREGAIARLLRKARRLGRDVEDGRPKHMKRRVYAAKRAAWLEARDRAEAAAEIAEERARLALLERWR